MIRIILASAFILVPLQVLAVELYVEKLFSIGVTPLPADPVQFEPVILWLSVHNLSDDEQIMPLIRPSLDGESCIERMGLTWRGSQGRISSGEIRYFVLNCYAASLGDNELDLDLILVSSGSPADDRRKRVNVGNIPVSSPSHPADRMILEGFSARRVEEQSDYDAPYEQRAPHQAEARRFWKYFSTALLPQPEGVLADELTDLAERLRAKPFYRTRYYASTQRNYDRLLQLVTFAQHGKLTRENVVSQPPSLDLFLREARIKLEFFEYAGDPLAAAFQRCAVFELELLSDQNPDPQILFDTLGTLGIALDDDTSAKIIARSKQTNAEAQQQAPPTDRTRTDPRGTGHNLNN